MSSHSTTNPIMFCRHCKEYIGTKVDLDDYFFWCNKECFDKDKEVILKRNQHSIEHHEDAYKDKPRFSMTGSVDSKDNNGEVVAVEDTKKSAKKPRKSKKDKEG